MIGPELENLKEALKRLDTDVKAVSSPGEARTWGTGRRFDGLPDGSVEKSARVGDGMDLNDERPVSSMKGGALSLRKILADIEHLVEDVGMLQACG